MVCGGGCATMKWRIQFVSRLLESLAENFPPGECSDHICDVHRNLSRIGSGVGIRLLGLSFTSLCRKL